MDSITPESVSAILRDRAGLSVPPGTITLERRGDRWFARLADDLLLFATDEAVAADRLAREGRLLQALAPRVPFAVPVIREIGPGIQLRRPVPGMPLVGGGRERAFADQPQGRRLAAELGRALAALHRAFTPAEAEALGYAAVEPVLPPAEALQQRVAARPEYPEIAAGFDRLLALYRETRPAAADIVLAHGDVWGGNLAVDHETGALNGLFDFSDAGLADRHVDLMHIHSFGPDFAGLVFATYAAEAGHALSRQRTALYHAIAAFAALADLTSKDDGDVLEQRRRWVLGVCAGPVSRIALAG
jgi:aminoglycoside phosphotransferase (APT) family kinase protein